MANQEREEAERLWEFVERWRRGTPSEDPDDPLLRLAQYVGEATEGLPSAEGGCAAARAKLAAAMHGDALSSRLPRSPVVVLLPSWWSWHRAAAVTALLLCAVFFYWRFTAPLALSANLLVKDHLKFLSHQSFVEHRSGDSTEVAFWLSHQVGFPVAAIDLSATGTVLLGGRRCHVGGQRVALSFYAHKNTRISLFQLEGGRCRLRGLEEVPVNGRAFLVGADKGFNVVAWEGGNTLCVLVSAADTSTLLKMAEAARRENST